MATSTTTSPTLAHLIEALQAVHNPRTPNNVRHDASAFLESSKTEPEAPDWGFALASDTSQPAEVRHMGLKLLEHGIRYGFTLAGDPARPTAEIQAEYEIEARRLREVRSWIERLAGAIGQGEPNFVRNKVAQLWVEVAKRLWGGEEEGWAAMDSGLVALWEGRAPTVTGIDGSRAQPQANNSEGDRFEKVQMVLEVLETLSEDVFNRDDAAVQTRGTELGKACVDVFIPASVLATEFPDRDAAFNGISMRCGEQGWIARIAELLQWCLGPSGGLQGGASGRDAERVADTVVKALATLRAAVGWVMPKALAATEIVPAIARGLAVPVLSVQLAAVECLHALYTRGLQDEEFVELVNPMYTSESVALFKEVYGWSIIDVNDIDEDKYKLCKKLSEFLSNLAHLVDLRNHLLPADADLTNLFFLLYDIMRNPSLVVSIPILHVWTRLLRNRNLKDSDAVNQLIQGLLETCSERLVRYEAFPEETNDPTITLLNDDIDTLPERHAFLGNYRRYCVDVIELIVRKSPLEALRHILGHASQLFEWLTTEVPPNSPSQYSKHSTANLKTDAQVTVIDAALKGYLKWTHSPGSESPQEVENTRNEIQTNLVDWCQNGPIKARFDDPDIMKKLIQMLVTFATKALPTRPAFAAMVLEYIISVSDLGRGTDPKAYPQLVEAYKAFDVTCTVEMQRLAMAFPDHLIGIYDELERRINDVIASKTSDEKMRLGYMGFLFIIVHRATTVPQEAKEERLRSMLQPIRNAWTDPKLAESLTSFESFCQMLNLNGIASFLERKNFATTGDWASTPLDPEGAALQAEINARFQALPLRLTKSLLGASTEKMGRDTAVYTTARALWEDLVPVIVPNLLQMISHAQAFNNLDNWQQLSPALQGVIKRVLTDRFWQSGISTESRDDFFARVSSSKSTYEGLASSIRGTVRQIREAGYFMLYNLATFGDMMFGIPDLPEPMSRALFQNAHALSAHHVSVLLGIAAPLVEMCPPQCREHFLPPFISGLFRQLERKIGGEWETVRDLREQRGDGDDKGLGDEMKRESILRQLTFSSVSLAGTCLEFKQPDPHKRHALPPIASQLPTFTLSSPNSLEPLLVFLRTSLLAPDTRSSQLSARIFLRSVLPHFSAPSLVRTFLTTDLLRAAITALHDPFLVDAHKDAAALIGGIIGLNPWGSDDNDASNSPRAIVLSLPGLSGNDERVDRAFEKITGRMRPQREAQVKQEGKQIQAQPPSERAQRAVVLDLLAGVRGVGIHEMGKVEGRSWLGSVGREVRKRDGGGLVERYSRMEVGKEDEDEQKFVGVAGMFEEPETEL